MDITSNHPNGWKFQRFREIGMIINGDRGKNYPSKSHYISKGIPFVSAGNIENNELDIINLNYISEERFNLLNSGKLQKGDIIYCLRGSLGKCAICTIEIGAIASSLCVFRLNEKINKRYVFYYLCSPFGQFEIIKHNNGTAQPNLSAKSFSNYEIYMPSEKQQQSIVEEIETQFTRLDASIKSLKSVKDKLEVYRKSVLKAAFEEGKKEKLGDVCTINPSKTEVKDLDKNLEVSFIPMAYVSENGKIISMDTRKLSAVNKGFTFFKNQDVLLAKITPCFENGKKTIAENLINGVGFGTTEFYVLRPNKEVISKWIFYNISREDFRALAKRSMGGAVGQQRVAKTMVENFEIPVPSVTKQEQIIQEIEAKYSIIEKIEKTVDASLDKAEQLRKSILKSAFEGKLLRGDLDV